MRGAREKKKKHHTRHHSSTGTDNMQTHLALERSRGQPFKDWISHWLQLVQVLHLSPAQVSLMRVTKNKGRTWRECENTTPDSVENQAQDISLSIFPLLYLNCRRLPPCCWGLKGWKIPLFGWLVSRSRLCSLLSFSRKFFSPCGQLLISRYAHIFLQRSAVQPQKCAFTLWFYFFLWRNQTIPPINDDVLQLVFV